MNGNYRLQSGSPSIDVGTNEWVFTTTDLDGNARIVNRIVDIGAYEYQIDVPPPMLGPLANVGGTVTLTWSAMTGQSYQPQYNPDLTPGNWTDLGSPIVAFGTTVSATNPNPANSQGFYRIVMMR